MELRKFFSFICTTRLKSIDDAQALVWRKGELNIDANNKNFSGAVQNLHKAQERRAVVNYDMVQYCME